MSKIKTPEEFYEQEVGLNAELGYQPTPKEAVIKAMEAYHKSAMKAEEEEYIILKKALEVLRTYRGEDFVTEVVADLAEELKPKK